MESAPPILSRPDRPRRGRLSLAAGQALIAAWRSSGLSMSQYGRAHGHAVATLERWSEKSSPVVGNPPRFVEINVDRPVGSIEIVTGMGSVVRVGLGFDAAQLRAVIAALSTGC